VPDAKLRALESDDLAETLTAVARTRVAHVMTPAGLKLQRIINSESYRFPDMFTLSYEQGTMPVVNFLIDLLQRHRVARADMAALTFMSMVVSGPVRVIVSGNALSQREIEDRIAYGVDLFLNGVMPRKGGEEAT
jgi:hypothetical protein